MVALTDTFDRRRVEEAARMRRLFAGEPVPVEVVADPDDAECVIVQDTENDTGVYMQFSHRAFDGTLRAGVGRPSPVKLADTPTPAPPLPSPPRGLHRTSIVVAILAAIALVVAALVYLREAPAASIVVGVAGVLLLVLACLSDFVVAVGRRDGIVQ